MCEMSNNFMKQISAEELIGIIAGTKKFPLTINHYIISGTLQNTELQHIRFSNCHFTNTSFINCKIVSCVFSFCQFAHINIQDSTVHHSIIKDCTIFNMLFTGGTFSTSKITNTSSRKMIFDQTQIKHAKFMFSSLIATAFRYCSILDCIFEYSVFDASKFEDSSIANSTLSIMNMRGVHITGCNITGTIFDDINFSDALNKYQSEFFIPTKYTTIKNNTVLNVTIANTILKDAFEDFLPHSKSKPNKTIIQRKYKYTKNESTRHFLPQNLKGKNLASLITFCMQGFLTAAFVFLFKSFYSAIQDIEYKQLQTFIEFPLPFIENTVEIHDFCFYYPLIYFATSALILCMNVVAIRGISNILLIILYRLQSLTTCGALFWVYWYNLQLKSNVVSIANLLFAFYFLLMVIQSFGTTSGRK